MLIFLFQDNFEDFLKQRAKETIIAAQKQAELISKLDKILISPKKNEYDH